MADFAPRPVFGFPETGPVRNQRELWERGPAHGVRDGYELSYQAWNVVGLEAAAEMACHRKDPTAPRWPMACR